MDQRMLGKVRALLHKAESTEFPREAEALTARAQELIARHNLHAALLEAEHGGDGHGPGARVVAVDQPYAAPKATLLHVVAEANRCRAVWHRERGEATVLGYPDDLAGVELLFTSLLVQATSAMVRAGSRTDGFGRSRTRSFRHAFLSAYALRIGERLSEAAEQAVGESDAPGLGLVLASRDAAVQRSVAERFPRLRRFRGGGASNADGWVHGRAAADRAALGHTALASDHE
ncbi:DUF2786 domain-containing protein [Actinocorallia sp. A-T 12471]|uniref:DUF2786 domain-containing protein n=1 Tax=Actinocorallia sp. A-T 12471 TaxID=3089813 RepID=UPI0029D2E07B|nr:DUF2786 domain-containing protein [Actinocorallia sp. A-T 12471]MDX6741865.1 DUF2786 domain-containing protein [Actinocorallia sp. A-T 12471]